MGPPDLVPEESPNTPTTAGVALHLTYDLSWVYVKVISFKIIVVPIPD